ncbi:PAS domain S-box protein [bacterium]|nr:MAG: PAS domain S-box protein [bacterium]
MKSSFSLTSRLRNSALFLGFCWTALVGVLLTFNIYQDREKAEYLAKIEAFASYNKDLLYRRWSAAQGGVYVPATDKTPPNPYLAGLKNRDVTTTSGLHLTLINPAYMTRQVFELAGDRYGIRSHITSLKPLRPENAPDPWEAKALESFENGATEASSIECIGGERFMRYIRPFVTEESCLKCHAVQGYKVGDVRGGISVSVPLGPYLEIVNSEMEVDSAIFLVIWGIGLGLLVSGFSFMSGRVEEKEKAETKLRESEEKYRLVSQNTGDVIWVIDLATMKFTFVSPSVQRLRGYTVDEAMGQTLDKVLTPESARRFYASLPQIIAAVEAGDPTAIVCTNEISQTRKDGTIVFTEVVTSVITGDGGKPVEVVGVSRDITERKRTTEELFETKAILQAALDNSQAGIVIADAPDGTVRYINRAGQIIMGRSEEDLLKKFALAGYVSALGMRHGDGTPLTTGEAPLARAVKHGETSSREFLIRRPGGEDRWILSNAGPIYGEDRKVRAGIAVFMDITERKHAEESMARLATAVEQAADDIIISDSRGVIQYVNPAFERSTGYARSEVTGKKVSLLYGGGQEAETYKNMKSELDAGRSWQGRFINRAKGGKEIVQSVGIAPIRDKLGAVIGYVSTQRDITQQEEMEKRFSQSQKLEAIGVMAGGIAHDFNNILSAIIGYGELALDECDNPELREDIQGVLLASNRAVELVKQILAFSRQGKREEKPVMVKPIVKEAMKLLRASIPSTVEITTEIKTDSVILGDPTEIHSIIVNLCTNASLAMREKGGALTVSLDSVELDLVFAKGHPNLAPGRYVRLTVSDTGCGMTPEVREHIFEPFFTTRKKGEGTGMGLATVHGIVGRMGGAISVESGEGKGTTFQIYLPVVETGMGKEAPGGDESPLPGNERILFVDDELMVVTVAKKALGKLGYRVTVSSGSPEALEIFSKSPDDFDIVVTDMTMPAMTGDQLAKEIRAIRPSIPVILCTGYSEKINERMATELGIEEFLQKPVVLSQLTGVIRKIMDKAS